MSWKVVAVFCLMLLLGCSPQPEKPLKPFVERVPLSEMPNFSDDLDLSSLRTAIERSLDFLDRVPGDRTYSMGELKIRVETIKASLLDFLKLVEAGHLDGESIDRTFDVYRFHTEDEKKILVTGYYEPVLEARLEPSKEFCYPVYGIPPDLLTIDLAAFDFERFPGERLVGRLAGNRVIPYYTRAEIDGQGKLKNSGCQLAWLRDPIDVYFLQVQGSGMLRVPEGRVLRMGYAGANGRPYKSIGKYLIEKGVMSREEVSLQTIRSFLNTHPEDLEDVLFYNQSYVFFRWVKDGPMGSINVPLTSGRSIATDFKFYPRGALAFLESEKPRLDANGAVEGWEPLRRWVLNQDTGGAIKGSGRVDLFCGSGETAERVAGRLKQPGRLFFLVKKAGAGN